MAGKTILIVEDDGIIATHFQYMLTGRGYNVLAPVASGEEAILVAAARQPDLVLVDIELAGEMNGITAAGHIRAAADVPVIFLTAYSEDKLLQQAKAIAPYGYLVKPVPERELAATVEMALHRHTLDRRLKESEAKLRESLEQVRRAVETTIQVLVMAVEVKDPYTAGHQRRSTDLARTIATEMGLPPKQIEGLRMAGVIHDIGKITLPTEILSKPTNLSNIELSLIREHVRLGYDILKDVESPWPLAEVLLQHHERMDGSGYPRGLKGKEIIIEARILAVADVVEAMASYRPYRPALGMDAALEEIEKNSGVLYDPIAVETCLRLIREKGYQFPVR